MPKQDGFSDIFEVAGIDIDAPETNTAQPSSVSVALADGVWDHETLVRLRATAEHLQKNPQTAEAATKLLAAVSERHRQPS